MKDVFLFLFLFNALVAKAEVRVTPSPRPPEVLHYFGGEKAAILLRNESSADANLKVEGDLFQLAGGLAAPLLTNLPALDISPEERTLELTLPAVRSKVVAVLRLRSLDKSGTTWSSQGSAYVVIHPPKKVAAEALRDAFAVLERQGLSVVVFGDGNFFADILAAVQVPFRRVQNLDEVPSDAKYVSLGTSSDWTISPSFRSGMAMIRLTSDFTRAEGLSTSQDVKGFEARLNLPLPDSIPEPLRWQFLSEAIHEFSQSLSTNP